MSKRYRVRDSQWGMVPLRAALLPGPALRLLVALSSHADADRLAYPSQEKLAEELDWYTGGSEYVPDRRRVQKWLKVLEDPANDLVRKHGRHVWAGRRWTHQYLVAPFPDADTTSASMPYDDADLATASTLPDGALEALSMRTFRGHDADIPALSMRSPGPHKQTKDLELTSSEQTTSVGRKERDLPEIERTPEEALRIFDEDLRRAALEVDAHAS